MALVHYIDLDLSLNELQNAKIEQESTATHNANEVNRLIIADGSGFLESIDPPIKPFAYAHADITDPSSPVTRWEKLWKYRPEELRLAQDNFDINSNKIINLTVGVNDTDAVNVSQLNDAITDVTAGLTPIGIVQAVSTSSDGNIDTTTGGLISIDGYTVEAGDKVLLLHQTDASDNVIWIAAAGAWSKDTRLDADGEIYQGMLVTDVENGTSNEGTSWYISSEGNLGDGSHDVSGTPQDVEWELFRTPLSLTAGDGIDITGSTISTDIATVSALEYNSAKLKVKIPSTNTALDINGSNELDLNTLTEHFSLTESDELKIHDDIFHSIDDDLTISANSSTNKFDVELKENVNHFERTSGVGAQFSVKLNSNGLGSDASGIKVKIDNDTIKFDGSGQLYADVDTDSNTEVISFNGSTVNVTTGEKTIAHNLLTSHVQCKVYLIESADPSIKTEVKTGIQLLGDNQVKLTMKPYSAVNNNSYELHVQA